MLSINVLKPMDVRVFTGCAGNPGANPLERLFLLRYQLRNRVRLGQLGIQYQRGAKQHAV